MVLTGALEEEEELLELELLPPPKSESKKPSATEPKAAPMASANRYPINIIKPKNNRINASTTIKMISQIFFFFLALTLVSVETG